MKGKRGELARAGKRSRNEVSRHYEDDSLIDGEKELKRGYRDIYDDELWGMWTFGLTFPGAEYQLFHCRDGLFVFVV